LVFFYFYFLFFIFFNLCKIDVIFKIIIAFEMNHH